MVHEPNDPKSATLVIPHLVPSITSGLVIGMLEVALAISFAALIYAGSLAPFLSQGIGYALFGAIIGCTIITLFTSWPGFIGGNQDVPAAILALMSAAMVGSMPATATATQTFVTVVVLVGITTMLTGIFFLATGYFHLGGLVRFLPYPVVGGFLAGTGWLLITGAISLMADMPVTLSQWPALLQSGVILRWLPGAILAVMILVASNRIDHYLFLPGMLLLSVAVFFLIAWISGLSPADLSAGNWLLGPFAGEGLWQPLTPAMLAEVHWPAILSQAAGIAAVVLVSAVSLLLNVSGVELAVDRDIDADRELRVGGVANVLSGLGGGLVGYHQLSLSILNYKLQAANRLTGLIGAAVCGLTLVAGASYLAFFPKMVVGALIFLLGLSFIVEWVVEGWSKLPRIDYAIVITILLVTAVAGFLQAVAFGLLLAVVLFVVSYSRVDVVRHELSGATYHSRVVRSREEDRLLSQYGEEIYILQLQGFIFFGTADSLLKQVQRRAKDEQQPALTAVVLDFDQVSGLDSTAMISFNKMKMLAQVLNFALVVCGVNARVRKELVQEDLSDTDGALHFFDTVDEGVAWCEQRLLSRLVIEQSSEHMTTPAILIRQMADILEAERKLPEEEREQLEAAIRVMFDYFEQLDIEAGTRFISQGEQADEIYLLVAGTVTARLAIPDGRFMRLETMYGSGRILGEIGFFLGGKRTADVVAEEPSSLYRLTRAALVRMEAENPRAASLLRRLIANVLAERVVRLTNTVRALER